MENKITKKINLYEEFLKYSVRELFEQLKEARTKDEKNFYTSIYNLKLAINLRNVIEKNKF